MAEKDCPKCFKTFSSNRDRDAHVKCVQDKIKDLKCDKCDYTSGWASSLRKHKNNREGPDYVECSPCLKTFSTKYNRDSHIKKSHGEVPNNVCPQCSKAFSRPEARDLHIKCVHDNIRDLKCDNCDFITGWPSNLDKHRKTHDENRTEHKCPKCEKKLFTKQAWNDHIKGVHDKTKDLTCNRCSFTTAHHSSFYRHMQLHKAGQFLYECHICFKTFGNKQIRDDHIKCIHERKELLKCDNCTYTTFRRSNLQSHMKSHQSPDLRPRHKCLECPTTFSVRWSLYRHMSQLHGKVAHRSRSDGQDASRSHPSLKTPEANEKTKSHQSLDLRPRQKCPECPTTFSARWPLYRHMSQLHGKVAHMSRSDGQDASRSDPSLKTPEANEKTKATIGKLQCQKCDFTANNVEWMAKHELKH